MRPEKRLRKTAVSSCHTWIGIRVGCAGVGLSHGISPHHAPAAPCQGLRLETAALVASASWPPRCPLLSPPAGERCRGSCTGEITRLVSPERSVPRTHASPASSICRQQWNGQPGSHTPISHERNCLQNWNLHLLSILPNFLSPPISPCSVRHPLFQHKYRFFWKCDLFPLILISSCILQFKKQNP